MAHPLPLPPVLVLYQFTVMFRHKADEMIEIMKQQSSWYCDTEICGILFAPTYP